MPSQITCPVCKTGLRVADDDQAPWVTCPRCLTQVMNPRHGVRDALPAVPASGPAAAPAEAESAGPRCPECDAKVEPAWRHCPFCNAALGRVRDVPRVVPADLDVRRDSGMAGGGLVLLGLLGGVGIILYLCGGGLNQVHSQKQAEGIAGTATVVGVVLFVLVVAGMVLGASGKTSAASIGTTILGGIAIAVLVLAVVIAGVVFLFASCFGPCGRGPRSLRPNDGCVASRLYATRKYIASPFPGHGGRVDVARGDLSPMSRAPLASRQGGPRPALLSLLSSRRQRDGSAVGPFPRHEAGTPGCGGHGPAGGAGDFCAFRVQDSG